MSINDKKNEKQQADRTATATKLISRVIRYMLHYYKYPFLLVVACIMITAVATVIPPHSHNHSSSARPCYFPRPNHIGIKIQKSYIGLVPSTLDSGFSLFP